MSLKRVSRTFARLVGVNLESIHASEKASALLLLNFADRQQRNRHFKRRFGMRLLLDQVEIVCEGRVVTLTEFSSSLAKFYSGCDPASCTVLKCLADSKGNLNFQLSKLRFVVRSNARCSDDQCHWILHFNNKRIANGQLGTVRFKGRI